MENPVLSLECCRKRQQRLRAAMAVWGVDAVLLVTAEGVQYLTGYRPAAVHAGAVLLDAGRCVLVAANQVPECHAADEVRCFEAQWLCTLRQDQEMAVAAVLRDVWSGVGRLGVEGGRCGWGLLERMGALGAVQCVQAGLLRLRRKKDVDELAMIGHAIAATGAMYERAREVIRPGVTELEVFNELQAAAVMSLGEPWTATGNDYRCGEPGGAPRVRAVQAGELYVLDLGPAYRGYYADNCRTLAVSGGGTDEQRRVRVEVEGVLTLVEQTVRPGFSCRELFEMAKAALEAVGGYEFFHHLGHGIGLFPHEAPHLNPHWDEVFEVGDVFSVEPGLYGGELRAGIRIEDNYRVTESGVERLSGFSREF